MSICKPLPETRICLQCRNVITLDIKALFEIKLPDWTGVDIYMCNICLDCNTNVTFLRSRVPYRIKEIDPINGNRIMELDPENTKYF